MSTTTITKTTPTISTTISSSSNIVEKFQTVTAQSVASLAPTATTTTTKKLSNLFQCGHHQIDNNNNNNNGNAAATSSSSTTTATSTSTATGSNIRANNVKLRLKEKTKKKLEEKLSTSSKLINEQSSSAAAAAAAACFSGIVQETITSSTFSKIHDQMATIADQQLTMELLGASLSNMNQSTEQCHHHHHHHHHLFHNNNGNGKSQQSKTINNECNHHHNNNNKLQNQKQSSSITMKMKKLSTNNKNQLTNIIITNNNNNNNKNQDFCTKKDDCNCHECQKRAKIAEELIAEEESSKKKKQKKKKNKNNKNKKNKDNDDYDDNNNNDIKDDKNELDKKQTKQQQQQQKSIINNEMKSDIIIKENINLKQMDSIEKQQQQKSTTKTSDNKQLKTESITTTNKQQQQQQEQQSKSTTKKNKNKNKTSSTLNQLKEKEIVAKTSPTTTTTAKKMKEENKSITTTTTTTTNDNINESSNENSVEIQKWIKVKNKNKQQQSSSNDEKHQNKDNNNNIDSFDNNNNNNNNDNDNDFKNDKSRKSNNENDDENIKNNSSLIINDNEQINSGLGSRNNLGLSSTAAQSKAKLLAIEAQMAHYNNELKGAVQYISEAIEIDSKNPIYYINRAYYHECLNEYEHAIRDTESALRFDDCNEFIEHILYLKSRCLLGLEQYEQAEQIIFRIKNLLIEKNQQQKFRPLLDKDLLLIRIKKLISLNYQILLSRIYAKYFSTINECINEIEKNMKIISDYNHNHNHQNQKINKFDPIIHLYLIIFIMKRRKNKKLSTKSMEIFYQEINNNKIYNYWLKEFNEKFLLKYDDDDNDIDSIDDFNNDSDDDDDDEIFFSDDDEYEQLYGDPEQWNEEKKLEIFKKKPINYIDTKEPPNSKGQKALWIGNVSPNCSLTFVTNLFMKFGNVTFCKIFTNDPQQQRNLSSQKQVAYLLLHYDNDISPRLVMSYFKDRIVPEISKDNNRPLIIRFRNKNDKIDDQTTTAIMSNLNELNSSTTAQSIISNNSTTTTTTSTTNGSSSSTSSSSLLNSPSSKSECYYYRTTGCDRQHCTFRHVLANKGVDKQTWMRKKN